MTDKYRVLCSDGIVRTATVTGEPDTVWTVPARVSVHGRTVTGSVYHRGNLDFSRPGWPAYSDDDPIVWRFSAYQYRKNADALPPWPNTAPADA